MLICGIDEVGRGAWAGPVVVGAVVFDDEPKIHRHKTVLSSLDLFRGSATVPSQNTKAPDLTRESNLSSRATSRHLLALDHSKLKDSKQLTKTQRETLSLQIKSSAVAIGIGWVDAATLDKIGLSRALKLATVRAYSHIPPDICDQLDQIIIDGTIRLLDDPRVTTLIKADAKISAVSAGAIAAKVARDTYMRRLAKLFPDYNFDKHVGYGTSLHRQSLEKFGALDGIHRKSFAPIANVIASNAKQFSNVTRTGLPRRSASRNDKLGAIDQTTGRIAETAAAEFLKTQGHQIITRNWKTKFCEIDIISTRAQTIFFTEVKYRKSATQGDGLAAITPRKLKQMRFAAEIFLNKNADLVKDFSVQIAAISLTKNPPQVDQFIENIS